MSEFDPAIEFVLKHEGGYVFDPDDPGGETNFGICKRTHPNADIKNLSREEAKEIYRRDYWEQVPYQCLASQLIANKLFDMAVNMGFYRAHCILQQALCDIGRPVKVDGVFGARTISAVNDTPDDALLPIVKLQAVKFYVDLAKQRPSSEKYLRGWMNRANA